MQQNVFILLTKYKHTVKSVIGQIKDNVCFLIANSFEELYTVLKLHNSESKHSKNTRNMHSGSVCLARLIATLGTNN